MLKYCPCCIADKPEEDFYLRKESQGRAASLSSWCRRCIQTKASKRDFSPGEQALRNAKHRAKEKGLPYDLDDHRAEIIRRVLAGCELSGIPFTIAGARDWDSPSIDRIRPAGGYVLSNVRIILWCLNSLFGYWGEGNAEFAVRAWLARKD